jgi:hypothetical protein
MSRIRWAPVLEHAAEIVESYETGVTLRQLFYRLVADETLPNLFYPYQNLGALTAKARRAGAFPPLIDATRAVYRPMSFEDPDDARSWLRRRYRLDRTRGQAHRLLIAAEKQTLSRQLDSWYAEPLGIPTTVLRGYGSTPLKADIDAEEFDVILYVGDLDPTGEDIERNLGDSLKNGGRIIRVAVTPEQVERYSLPPLPGKTKDPRAAGFIARHGELMQVEVEALDPLDLRALIDRALEPLWDSNVFDALKIREERERAEL